MLRMYKYCQVGSQKWYRWVIVDIEPPRLSALLAMSKTAVRLGDPVTASSNTPSLRFYLYILNISEPVRSFDLADILQSSGYAEVINSDCFPSVDTATLKMKAALGLVTIMATAPSAIDGPAPSAPPAPLWTSEGSNNNAINRQQLSLLSANVDYAASYTLPYVQSCLAVMYAPEGSNPSMVVPEGAVVDLMGNPNNRCMGWRDTYAYVVRSGAWTLN